MTLKYNVSGENRKQLVYAMATLLKCKPFYLRTPTCAYQVGNYNVGRNGEVSFDDRTADTEEIEMMIEKLKECGFIPEAIPEMKAAEPATEDAPIEVPADKDEPISDLVVSMPMEGFDEGSLERLKALVASKHTLLQKAIGTKRTLAIGITGDRVCFPWFHGELDADHVKAYTHLIVQMCALAKNSKRISAKEKPTDNDRYAFRCFLLRLGFIGDDYKRMRKILLKKLEGSSAFRNGAAPAHTAPTLGKEVQEND